MSETSSLIARQPICNKQLKVVAFELLYRMQSNNNEALVSDNDGATIDDLVFEVADLIEVTIDVAGISGVASTGAGGNGTHQHSM